MKPTEPGFDADASCSVLWSFARPGKNEKVPAEVASLFTLPQGKTDLTLLTAAEALRDAGRDEGNFWGMVKVQDSKKKSSFKPAQQLYVRA